MPNHSHKAQDKSAAKQQHSFSYSFNPQTIILSWTAKSIVIAVIGITGAGKTHFIKHITELDEIEIGHSLKSCTKQIHIATTYVNKYEVHLINTPGFNNDELEDSDILYKITNYLKTGIRLSGILYLHPITDSRMGGPSKRNLDLLRNLVGPENMGNIKLITTNITDEESKGYLHNLLSDFWREILANRAQIDRYNGTGEDGKRIIRSILRTAPVTLLLQAELNKGIHLVQTSAGKSLMEEFNKLQEKCERGLQELKDNAAAEREKYEEALRKRDKVAEQARKLYKV
ncbi:unnamed protein product [Clonostachys chloroleuca]|uniref:G domain-containing protein n=1 Tax=Clonostachys chloroleuca TaxID=1926264 RepID=A0AA35VS10_9HYPO|nr:unnamed protein product [Clonostachys chloroleuca]